MKKHFLSFVALLFAAQVMWAASVTPADQIPTYWASANGKSGANLWQVISTQTNVGYSSIGYNGLWTAYATTDVYPGTTKIWDMYGECDFTYNNDKCGSYSNVCDCYNREHSIPQSWWGGGTSGIGCDIFHLVPTDGKINGVRSNDEFGEVNGGTDLKGNKSGTAGSWSTDKKTIASSAGEVINGSGHVFEPKAQYKGDFARGYMGTIIKWHQSNLTTDNNFSGIYDAAHYFGFTKKAVVLMMKWHREDPVSQKEIDRNNGIQKTQGNRNPFIDYPYLAEYIWGEKAGETVDMSQLMPSTDPDFIPGQSNGWRGGDTPTPATKKFGVSWSVNGTVVTIDSIAENGKISTLPTKPTSCSAESNVFMGWTDAPIVGTQDNAPAHLYAAAAEFPAVTANIIFYAVFAQETAGQGVEPAVYTYDAESSEGWTNTANKKGSYWLLDSGKELVSPEIDLSGLSSVKANLRTYGGTQYDQFAIKAGSNTLCTIEVSGGSTLKDYEWTNTKSLSGKSKLTFICANAASDKGVGFASVTVNATGAGVTYSRYITTCQDPQEVELVGAEEHARKVMVGGQIYIQLGEQLFTITGQRVK